MALSDNPFIGLPLADIIALQSTYIQVLRDVAAAGQSYSFQGRTFTRADIKSVTGVLSQLRAAINVTQLNGTGKGAAIGYAYIDSLFKW